MKMLNKLRHLRCRRAHGCQARGIAEKDFLHLKQQAAEKMLPTRNLSNQS